MKRVHLLRAMLLAACFVTVLGYWPGQQAQQAFAAEVKTYSFGVVPQFEQRKLYAVWKPIIEDLQKRTGLQFNLVTTLKIQDFESAFRRGEFDFVYVNPYHLIQVQDAHAYLPLVADSAALRGVLVVRKDGSIEEPSDLNGQRVAFPSPNALGASLLVRADLDQIHHVNPLPMYVTTHSSVYLHVIKGLAVAGGGVEKTLQEQDESIRSQLRVIYTTRSCPSHPVAVHPRVDKLDQEKVRQALLDMSASAAGKALLKNVPVQQFTAVDFSNYAIMRGWGLEKYWQTVQGE